MQPNLIVAPFNEIHRIINEIHRSKPKPTSVASEKVVEI